MRPAPHFRRGQAARHQSLLTVLSALRPLAYQAAARAAAPRGLRVIASALCERMSRKFVGQGVIERSVRKIECGHLLAEPIARLCL